MGDLIEFTTKAGCEFVFYEITTGALRFSIKGEGDAAVILSRNKCVANNDYWFNIGKNMKTWIETCGSVLEALTPNILSTEEYRDFYISWGNGYAQLGVANEQPLLKEKINKPGLCYVAFVTTRRGHQLHWKCHLPPQIPKPTLRRLSGGEPQWVKTEDQLPDGAICGGYENETLYIIRAPHRGSLTPGKFVPSEGVGYIPWGGSAHEKNEFEVLCGCNYTWVPTKSNKIPVGAVQAGYSEDYKNEILYVGRAKHNGQLIPGKVQPTHKVCYVPYDGDEVAKSEFEVLILPYANTRSVKKWFIPDLNVTSAVHHYQSDSNNEDSSDSDSDEDDNFYQF